MYISDRAKTRRLNPPHVYANAKTPLPCTATPRAIERALCAGHYNTIASRPSVRCTSMYEVRYHTSLARYTRATSIPCCRAYTDSAAAASCYQHSASHSTSLLWRDSSPVLCPNSRSTSPQDRLAVTPCPANPNSRTPPGCALGRAELLCEGAKGRGCYCADSV